MIANMRKFSLKAHVRAIRKDQLEDDKLLGTQCKVEDNNKRDQIWDSAIKTLPKAQLHEMAKVKEELKAMLPTLTPAEVRR